MAEPTPSPGVFDRLLKDRIIWLGSEVRDDNANEIAAKLLLLAAEDAEEGHLPLRQLARRLDHGRHGDLRHHAVRAERHRHGRHRHGGLDGAAAPHRPARRASATSRPNARVLLHQPHGGFGGTASDIQTQAQLILDMKKRLAEITAAQTGKSVEQINADGDRDRWFNAQEALEYGFVDHIRESALDVSGGGGTDQAA
jgi:ATP-dependent Clp protease protease subunit